MTQDIKTLPENPTRRKIIVVGDDVFFNQAREDESPWLKNPNVYIVNTDDDWGGALFNKLKDKALLNSGTTLIQDPYETDFYMRLEEDKISHSLLKSAQKRQNVFEQIAKHLGAVSLKIEEKQQSSRKGNISANSNYKVADGSADFDIAHKLQETLSSSTVFPGGKTNVKAAYDVLERYNLTGDYELQSLIELRRGNNPIAEKEVCCTVCRELSTSLELSVKLGLPGISDGGKLKANLKTASESYLYWCIRFEKNKEKI